MLKTSISNIHHYAFSVNDLQAPENRYQRYLGFAIERQFGFPELDLSSVIFFIQAVFV
jgi:catechol 2,3-dioxygenase-like lactoylglutathione lyase family enzyme